MTKKVYCFDIDGTLADIEHRRHFVQYKPKNWPAFNRAMVDDLPMQHIIDLYNIILKAGHNIIICSGRGSEYRTETEDWLEDNGVHGYLELLMRPEKNNEADTIIKGRMADYIEGEYGPIELVFDDRDSVVKMWRERGIPCAQVAPGDF